MTQLDQRASMRRMQLARTAWAKLRAQAGRGPVEPVETEEEPQNPETYRAMDLVLRVGELLLASGEATETVSEAMRSLAVAYGLPRSEAAVTFTAISLSCLPGHGAAPITGERVVRRRSPDHSRLVDTHQLVGDAALGMVELDEAFTRLHAIKHGPSRYPRWLTALSLPLLAAFAAVLFGGGPVIAVIALVATWAGERATTVLARRGVAEFYQFAATAMIAPATGLALVWTGLAATPSAVVSGALMALLPGRPLVASVQDGISGAFVSSGARLLEVFFIGAAIVSGAGMTMYLAARLGVTGRLDALPVFEAGLEPGQIVGAAGIAVTMALSLLAPFRAVLTAAVGGALIWVAYVGLRAGDVPPVLAVGVAAAAVGLLAHLVARLHRRPPLPYVVPIIGPLLPGSLLYRGLLEINTGQIDQGLLSLSQAIATALALAAGISLGGELVRTLRGNGLVGTSPRNRPAARRTRGY